ncbi:ribosomal protein S18-alanine N-acetyltransferase [Neptunicella sp.]|uniref:ribosomal protein S18-alanine N-acetyltransferase n=1 Tax=Neptunicella sp. TaxID=2125986 RepID=UPI003F690E2E
MAEIVFSRITPQNYQPAFQLHCACQAFPSSEQTFLSCLGNKYFAYHAILDDQVIGFYVGHQVLDELTLIDIGVSSNMRGKGFGRNLMTHFEQQCQQRGAQQIWLEVRESNSVAINLYQAFDFAEIEHRKNYYPTDKGWEDAIVMSKMFF